MERSDQRKDKIDEASEEPDDTVLKKEIDEISGRIDSILKTIENHFHRPELNPELNQDEDAPEGIRTAGELSG